MSRGSRRPTSVRRLGWLFVVVGLLMALGGSLALTHGRADLFKTFGAMAPLVLGLSLFQIGYGLFVLIAAVCFLRLKIWARLALELLCWLGFAYVAGLVAVFVAHTGLAIPRGAPRVRVNLAKIALGLGVIVYFWAKIVSVLKSLRGETIRTAFKAPEQTHLDAPQDLDDQRS